MLEKSAGTIFDHWSIQLLYFLVPWKLLAFILRYTFWAFCQFISLILSFFFHLELYTQLKIASTIHSHNSVTLCLFDYGWYIRCVKSIVLKLSFKMYTEKEHHLTYIRIYKKTKPYEWGRKVALFLDAKTHHNQSRLAWIGPKGSLFTTFSVWEDIPVSSLKMCAADATRSAPFSFFLYK